MKQRRNPEHQKRVEELRRSNAAQRHVNKTKYKRHAKHKNLTLDSY